MQAPPLKVRSPDGQDLDVEEVLRRLNKGQLALQDLPRSDAVFWQEIIEIAARRRLRVRKQADAVSIAQRLLSQQLSDDADRARKGAAATSLVSNDPRIRRWAIWSLRDAGEAGLDGAIQASRDEDDEVRLTAVHILSRSKSRKAIEALAHVVRLSHALPGTLGAEALVSLGAGAASALGALLDSDDDAARWRAVDCLARIHTTNCLAPLLRGLHDPSPDVSWRAADGLVALGEKIGPDVLRSALRQPLTGSTMIGLRHYAEHAQPGPVFAPVFEATRGLASGSAAPVAIAEALDALHGRRAPSARS